MLEIPNYIKDWAFDQWTAKDFQLLLTGALASYVVGKAVERYQERKDRRKQLEYFWREYLSPFSEEDFQGILGTCGGLSDYDLQAARKLIVPVTATMLQTVYGKLFWKSMRDFLTPDTNRNLIIYGDYEPCVLAESILNDDRIPYYTGLKVGDDYMYEPTSEHLRQIRQERVKTRQDYGRVVAAGETFIANRMERRVVYEPRRRDDGSYASDEVVITFTRSYWAPGRWLLGLSGVREMGTYMSTELLSNPKYISAILSALRSRAVRPGDCFQVVVEVILNPYKPGSLPGPQVINDIKVIDAVILNG